MQSKNEKQVFVRRIFMTIIGVIGSGICVGFFRMSVLGVDPFQAFMSGFDAFVPALGFGTLYVIVSIVLLLFAVLTDRTKIGLGTFINLFLLGYVIEFSHDVLLNIFGEVTMTGRIIFLIVGIVVLSFFASLYFTANMGVSVYDAVALVLSEKNERIPFKYWRVITDLVCVVIGIVLFLVGGNEFNQITTIIGVGTIITAFFMGPLVSYFNQRVAEPLLKIEGNE